MDLPNLIAGGIVGVIGGYALAWLNARRTASEQRRARVRDYNLHLLELAQEEFVTTLKTSWNVLDGVRERPADEREVAGALSFLSPRAAQLYVDAMMAYGEVLLRFPGHPELAPTAVATQLMAARSAVVDVLQSQVVRVLNDEPIKMLSPEDTIRIGAPIAPMMSRLRRAHDEQRAAYHARRVPQPKPSSIPERGHADDEVRG